MVRSEVQNTSRAHAIPFSRSGNRAKSFCLSSVSDSLLTSHPVIYSNTPRRLANLSGSRHRCPQTDMASRVYSTFRVSMCHADRAKAIVTMHMSTRGPMAAYLLAQDARTHPGAVNSCVPVPVL